MKIIKTIRVGLGQGTVGWDVGYDRRAREHVLHILQDRSKATHSITSYIGVVRRGEKRNGGI